MKSVRAAAVFLALWVVLAVHPARLAVAAGEPIVIRFSHVVGENTPKGQGALLFKKLAEERLAGKVEVQVFPNSTRFTDDEVLLALLFGDVELAAPSLAKFRSFSKSLQVFDLPFLFADVEAVHRFQATETGQGLLNSMTGMGIKGLGFWDNGMRVMSANRTIKTPPDLKGLIFRIEPSAVIEAQYKALDANVLRLPFNRVYDALNLGLVDGQENAWSNIDSQRFYDVQESIVESNHSFLGYMVVTSVKFWESLPDDIRKTLEQILDEVGLEVARVAVDKASSSRERVVQAMGADRVHTLSEEERAAWRDAMQPIWAQFQSEIGDELIRAADSQ